MELGKSNKSLVLKINNNSFILQPENGIEETMDITKGTVIGSQFCYTGIKLIINEDKEIEYTTESPIIALASEGGMIAVYENEQKEPWLLTQEGILLNGIRVINEKSYTINGEIRKKSDVDLTITVDEKIEKSYVTYKGEDFPIEGSLVIGDNIYGFKVIVKIPEKESTTIYPTHAPIYGVELLNGEIRLFENDKSIPWKFSKNGSLKGEADYNRILRSEQKDYCRRYGMTLEELERELNEPQTPQSLKLK